MDAAFKTFIEEVDAKRQEIRCTKSGAYFRGHSHSHYRLVPSLLRNHIDARTEHNLYHECYARAHRLIDRKADSWEFLSFLQHHGIPTRLLDWSESLASALFFAIGREYDAPHIWIVNGFLLNRGVRASAQPRILMTTLDPVPDYFECFVRLERENEWPYAKPIFVQIPWASDRIAAQQGFFTIHCNEKPLDEVCGKWVRRVDIPPGAIPGAQRFLELAGTNEHTIFPGFDGLTMMLRRRYPV